MTATQLTTTRVEKPWGRTTIAPFPNDDGARIGEIWFAGQPDGLPLMVKYLFTSEKLSIQVHPNDDQARARGIPQGKDEIWVVLDAEPGATIAMGLKEAVTPDRLATAARDGTIESLMATPVVKAGDVIYSAAGTVHALGAGLTVIEVQQNTDVTYRLWDYGRPRELHLEDGLAVSVPGPAPAPTPARRLTDARTILTEGGKFVLERWSLDRATTVTMPAGETGWFVPVTGSGTLDGAPFAAGECWLLTDRTTVEAAAGSDLLFAYARPDVLPLF